METEESTKNNWGKFFDCCMKNRSNIYYHAIKCGSCSALSGNQWITETA